MRESASFQSARWLTRLVSAEPPQPGGHVNCGTFGEEGTGLNGGRLVPVGAAVYASLQPGFVPERGWFKVISSVLATQLAH